MPCRWSCNCVLGVHSLFWTLFVGTILWLSIIGKQLRHWYIWTHYTLMKIKLYKLLDAKTLTTSHAQVTLLQENTTYTWYVHPQNDSITPMVGNVVFTFITCDGMLSTRHLKISRPSFWVATCFLLPLIYYWETMVSHIKLPTFVGNLTNALKGEHVVIRINHAHTKM